MTVPCTNPLMPSHSVGLRRSNKQGKLYGLPFVSPPITNESVWSTILPGAVIGLFPGAQLSKNVGLVRVMDRYVSCWMMLTSNSRSHATSGTFARQLADDDSVTTHEPETSVACCTGSVG